METRLSVSEHTSRLRYGDVKTFNLYDYVMYALHADWRTNAFGRIFEINVKPLPFVHYEGKNDEALEANEIAQLRNNMESFRPRDNINQETNVKVFAPYLQVVEWLRRIGIRASSLGGVHCDHFFKVLNKNEQICRQMLHDVAYKEVDKVIKHDRVQVLDALLEEHSTVMASREMIDIRTQLEKLNKDYAAKEKEIKRKTKLESLIKHVKTLDWETDEELISTCFDLSEHLKKRIKL